MKTRYLFLFILALGIVSCTTIEKGPEVSLQDGEGLFATGDYENAYKAFIAEAETSEGTQKGFLRIRAAAALARLERTHQARQIIDNINIQDIDSNGQQILRLSRAHLALAERQAEQAQLILNESLPEEIPAIYHAEFHAIRADAYTMLGNRLETARELVAREKYLVIPELIKQNQQNIWAALATMNERALQQLRTAPPPDVLSGWMELVQIAKVYQLSPLRLKEQILLWRQKYPGHPVSEELLVALSQRKQEDVAYPDRVALLLPLSGKFAKAGEAIRDGFLAAYFVKRPNMQQQVRIYDVADDTRVTELYNQAVQDGAEFIVGPLSKDALQMLSNAEELDIPTLALNYLPTENENLRANLYQFGLLPEEEARQVAERTWLDGHVNAAVLVPSGPWGERIYEAFKQRWELMGGKIVEQQAYDATRSDFSQPIKMLLDIDKSKQRYRRVATTLKRDIKFTERRRQDIDFIFLAAYPRQARLIRPQLKFYHASDVPVYATSHVFTGVLNQERDRDMDGMMFGDMPWVLAESTAHRGMRPELENHITDAGNALQRLYALGIDAFNIIGALNTLRNYPYERFDGETGSLSLDNQLRVRRQLTWVKFRSGRPVNVDQGNL
jgi:outer membrane PBP1 activator LpoA protein